MPHRPWSEIKHKKDVVTNPNKSHITIVADRSGSMSSVKSDAEGGINTFISKQKEQPGACTLYFVDFDGQEPQRVVYDGDLQFAGYYTMDPRGNTPLFDALNTAIHETGRRLRALREEDRPAHVFFIYATDGYENASREANLTDLTALIKQQEDQWKWTFIPIVTGKDAWQQSQMFVGTQSVGNVTRSSRSAASYGQTYTVLAANVSAQRAGAQNVNYMVDARDEDDKDDDDDAKKKVKNKRS